MTTYIDIENLSVNFCHFDPDRNNIRVKLLNVIRPNKKNTLPTERQVAALNNINLNIRQGERIGLIGANGSGKTTLLKIIARVLYPTQGNIEVKGRVRSIFDPNIGVDVEASGFENIRIRCMLLGVPKCEMQDKINYIAEFSELGEALSRPVKTYSSGMAMKLAFSIATSVSPEILVMDEWLSTGDAKFVSKALTKMQELISNSQILVLASHSEQILKEWCNRLIWINKGNIESDGEPEKVWNDYKQYTLAS